MSGPWSFEQSVANLRQAASNQAAVEDLMREAFRDYAVAEENYRKALATEIVSSHNDGVAWTAAADLARGDPKVAKMRRERDIAEGMKEAVMQMGWRRAADRRDAQRFADWSQRRESADGYTPTQEEAIP